MRALKSPACWCTLARQHRAVDAKPPDDGRFPPSAGGWLVRQRPLRETMSMVLRARMASAEIDDSGLGGGVGIGLRFEPFALDDAAFFQQLGGRAWRGDRCAVVKRIALGLARRLH